MFDDDDDDYDDDGDDDGDYDYDDNGDDNGEKDDNPVYLTILGWDVSQGGSEEKDLSCNNKDHTVLMMRKIAGRRKLIILSMMRTMIVLKMKMRPKIMN